MYRPSKGSRCFRVPLSRSSELRRQCLHHRTPESDPVVALWKHVGVYSVLHSFTSLKPRVDVSHCDRLHRRPEDVQVIAKCSTRRR